MSNVLSNNTQAILLLTAPLITGRSEPTRELLTPSEYKRLARHLHQLSKEPADLLSSDADEILRQGQAVVDAARLKRLLGRGFALSQAIDRWQARGIWVVSRADSNYPQRLRDRLREDRPAVLYGCGERTILERGGLAVVGSRDVDEALVEYTESIGRLTAKARKTLVSGGARGIDQAAMRGALEAGGMVSGVLADGLEKSAMNRDHRRLLMDGQLVLVSPYDPGAGFNVGNAMQRNKLIYALADAALVVNSDVEKGGTWAGAVEQLGKLKFVPVFVRSTGSASTGLTALLNKGAFPWPNPDDADGLVEALAFAPSTTRASALPSQLTLAADDDPSTDAPPSPVVPPAPVLLSTTPMPESPEVEMAVAAPAASSLPAERDPADDLYDAAKQAILSVLKAPKTIGELVDALRITEGQLKLWLGTLVAEGTIRKTRRKGVLYELPTADLIDFCSSPDATHRSGTKT
ncbi:MAG TPA: DNA-processing protein DprA [Candidatus Accumulibacter phosphatis]|nr:DNA-processing protein DprA [Candidatus Accumulibacter phosphatis]HRQ94010.1 DNA-processing protein DprA [Candidatus Accumulibacter phosphatis]HRQ94784.1 DNA-processing protein DprA [Candidatus Accumulibacter phosphatis]